jgi:hypothetical protein
MRDRASRTADTLVRVGAILLVLALLTRGLAVGRVPWGNMYEFTLAGAMTASVALVFGLRNEVIRPLAAWAVMIVLLALGLAVTVLWTPAGELVPVLDSYWLVVHVAAAIIAGGIFTLGFVTAVAYLIRARQGRAEAVALDRASYAMHLVAFPVWTFAVMAGAIWAENAWGRYWGWDPKETWVLSPGSPMRPTCTHRPPHDGAGSGPHCWPLWDTWLSSSTSSASTCGSPACIPTPGSDSADHPIRTTSPASTGVRPPAPRYLTDTRRRPGLRPLNRADARPSTS